MTEATHFSQCVHDQQRRLEAEDCDSIRCAQLISGGRRRIRPPCTVPRSRSPTMCCIRLVSPVSEVNADIHEFLVTAVRPAINLECLCVPYALLFKPHQGSKAPCHPSGSYVIVWSAYSCSYQDHHFRCQHTDRQFLDFSATDRRGDTANRSFVCSQYSPSSAPSTSSLELYSSDSCHSGIEDDKSTQSTVSEVWAAKYNINFIARNLL